MKKIGIIAIVVALIVVALAGCSSGSTNESAQDTAPANSGVTAASTQANTSQASTSTKASNSSKMPRAFKYKKGGLPSAFEYAVENSFVTVVAFYNSGDEVSDKVQDVVEQVVEDPDYRDKIKYFSYEVNSRSSVKVARLTTLLGVKYAPNISIIDADKNIVFEKSGFIETGFFGHSLYNVIYKDKSPN